jgi:S1-C subfamily serine protease
MSHAHPISPLQSYSDALCGLVTHAAPGVVTIQSHRFRASGIVWRPGLIVTADEALPDEAEITVTLSSGETVPATIAGRDPTTDIALLRVDRTNLQPAPLSPCNATAGALAIVVAGHDGGATAALGVVALAGPAWRSLRGGEIEQRLELDVALRRSAEGGLVLDAAGRGIGMAVFGPRRRVLVIPAATIDRVATRLQSHGRINRGYLGLGLHPVRLTTGGAGVMVMSIDAKGPAVAADVRQGDVIVACNGQAIRGIQSLLASLGPDSPGTTVTLSVLRGGAPVEKTLTVGERGEG